MVGTGELPGANDEDNDEDGRYSGDGRGRCAEDPYGFVEEQIVVRCHLLFLEDDAITACVEQCDGVLSIDTRHLLVRHLLFLDDVITACGWDNLMVF